jgi:hypothetical protein
MDLFARTAGACAVLALVMAGALACASHSSGDPHPGHEDAGTSGQVGCASDPRVSVFQPGLEAKSASGKLVAKIVSAKPATPVTGAGDAGINEWTVSVTMDGKPPQAGDLSVKTLMPDHGHGSPSAPTVSANPDGTFTIANLFLFMAGVWQITIVEGGVEAGPQELATFTICASK